MFVRYEYRAPEGAHAGGVHVLALNRRISYSDAKGATWLSGTSTGPQKARVTGLSCARMCWWLCHRWMSAMEAGSSGSHQRSALMSGLYQGLVPCTVGGWLSGPWMPRVVLSFRRYSVPAAGAQKAATQRTVSARTSAMTSVAALEAPGQCTNLGFAHRLSSGQQNIMRAPCQGPEGLAVIGDRGHPVRPDSLGMYW